MAPYTVVTILLVCVLLAVKAHSAPKGKGGRPKPPPWKYGGSSGKYGGGSREYGGGNRDYAGGREGENVFAKLFDYSSTYFKCLDKMFLTNVCPFSYTTLYMST